MVKRDKGTVIAFGDQTFLREPFCAQEEVEGFEEVLAEDKKNHFCARVMYAGSEHLTIDGKNMTIMTDELYWISSDEGSVKEEVISRYYVDGTLAREERRALPLKSIRKGSVLQSPLDEFFIPIPRL